MAGCCSLAPSTDLATGEDGGDGLKDGNDGLERELAGRSKGRSRQWRARTYAQNRVENSDDGVDDCHELVIRVSWLC